MMNTNNSIRLREIRKSVKKQRQSSTKIIALRNYDKKLYPIIVLIVLMLVIKTRMKNEFINFIKINEDFF